LYLSVLYLKQLFSLHKISVSIVSIFLTVSAYGGNPYGIPDGAGETGMGSVCVMRKGFWPSFINQASLAYNRSISTGISYENRFGISELGTRTAGLVLPAGKTSLGLIYSHFGYSDFCREMAGIACGLSLSENIAAGIQIDYFSEKTYGEYENYQVLTYEAGLIITPSEIIRIGIHLFNPVPNSVRKSFLPVTLRTGAGIDLSKMLFAGVEAEMSSGDKLIIRTGFEYEIIKNLLMRGGFSSKNTSFTMGMGYKIKALRLDLGFASHERLGITSSVSIVYLIK
jgi:hypothetical protein